MNDSDDYGFWDADRERSITAAIPRLSRAPRSGAAQTPRGRSRAEHPRVVAERASRGYGSSRSTNPLTRRVGVMVAVAALAVPVAWMMRGSDATDELTSVDPAAAADQEVVDPAVVDPAFVDPAVVDPAAVDPALVQPVVTTAPLPTLPGAAVAAVPIETETTVAVEVTAAATEPVVTEPATTQLETTQPETTQPATTAAARPVAVATPVVEVKPTCALEYEVRAGDYWISIADAADVKLAALVKANGATVATPIYPGRSICLPAGATMPAETTAAPTTVKATTTTVKATTTTVKATTTTVKPTSTTVKATATTAPSTTAAPATTAAPPANTYTRAQVEQIIRNVWPDDLEDEAVRIATRESNLIPTVRNSCCFGLFQIYFNANKASLVSWGITSASQLYDPQVNAYAAYAMYLRAGGWGPWAL